VELGRHFGLLVRDQGSQTARWISSTASTGLLPTSHHCTPIPSVRQMAWVRPACRPSTTVLSIVVLARPAVSPMLSLRTRLVLASMLWEEASMRWNGPARPSRWLFPRGAIPASITADKPETADFGVPLVNFQGDCDIDSRFKDHRFVFATNFCGDQAGNTYGSSRP
jgi:hypothetical protein